MYGRRGETGEAKRETSEERQDEKRKRATMTATTKIKKWMG
jgi:hypothetical protein